MNEHQWEKTGLGGSAYDARFRALQRAGQYVHGEADFVESLGAASVLDAGCGTGRVAIELARRGYEVVGVDRDADMLRVARQNAPHLAWHPLDLADGTIPAADGGSGPRLFEAVVLAGNVMIFLDAGTEAAVVRNLARHLQPGGWLVAGFQLHPGGLALSHYDACAARAGLSLVERWATWEKAPWEPGADYAVSVHRRPVRGS